MSETAADVDWKDEYRTLVREMESNEQAWRGTEELLRRAGRQLAIAAMGQSELLDRSLESVIGQLRADIEPERLSQALDALADCLRQLPRKSDASAVDVEIALVMRELVTRVGEAPVFRDVSRPLATDMERALDDCDWVALARGLADTVAQVTTALDRQKGDLEAFLGQVERQLEEFAGFNAWNREANEERVADASTLENTLDQEMRGLRADVDSAADIAGIKQKIRDRLAVVAEQMREFCEREAERQVGADSRAATLGGEIDRLKAQTRDLAETIEQKEDQLLYDALTGVHSRYAYEERLSSEFHRWERHGGQLAFALWDIDHFKRINDTLGHRAGDKLLKLIGQILLEGKREEDFLARIGGEEFVLLLPATGADQARVLAERIRTKVAETPFHSHGRPEPITVSCGLTEFREGDTPEVAFDRADRALYQAKNAGRNRSEIC